MLKSFRLMLVLSLLVPFAHDAAGRTLEPTPTRPSFKSGFSSQRPASTPAPSYRQRSSSDGASGGFGSFSGRRSAPPQGLPPAMPAPDRTASRNGGFGSFSGGADSAHRSESATSRQLSRRQAEENALRTLEERRAREAARTAQRNVERNSERDVERDSRPGQYERDQRDQRDQPNYRDYRGYRTPAPSYPPDVVRQGGGGLGNVVAGAVIANAINRHANASNNGNNAGNRQAAPDSAAPGNDWGLGPKDGHVAGNTAGADTAGGKATPGNGGQGGASFARVFLWLALLALLGAGGYFLWRRVRRKRDADKPNYSFERN
jgi:hypothetical protein